MFATGQAAEAPNRSMFPRCFPLEGGLRRLAACVCGCTCLLCVPSTVWAAPAGSSAEKLGPESLTSPQLLGQVVLDYPDDALASGAHGDVSILVDVGVDGAILEVRFESGPEVFQAAALEAGRRLEFAPARRGGVPVEATTRVWFHFAPAEAGSPEDGEVIVVRAVSADDEDTRARTTLDEAALERSSGDDLAQTVAVIPGVRAARGTADASKPIIRGHQERRLLVLNGGVRHESQKWGADHATEIDPFSAGSISVIRGAAGARYGPDAIGGVILVEPPPLRAEPGVEQRGVLGFASNGQRTFGAARVDVVPEGAPKLALRAEGSGAVGASLRAPDYVLGNTASRVWNLGGSAGWRWGSGQLIASWHHHDLEAGVFYGVRNSTPDDFQAQLDADRPVTADLWTTTYAIDRPYQDVTHDVGALRFTQIDDWGSLEAVYAFQHNHRLEFEQTRDVVTGPQYDFTLRTHSLDVLYRHAPAVLAGGDLEGGAGAQGSFQENVYRGYSMIPNYRGFGGGIFGFERLSFGRFAVEVGGRYDTLSRTVYMGEEDYQRHASRGSLDSSSCDVGEGGARCPTSYDAASLSVGSLLRAVPDRVDFKLDLSTASRFPDVDELYLVGSSPTFPVYALGYPELGVETAWGGSLTGGLRLPALEAELSGYGQYVDDYIYFAPAHGPSGELAYEVTIQGTWPRFDYQSIDAAVYGGDGSVQLGPSAPVGLAARGGVVRAQDVATGEHLIGIPADHLTLSLVGRPPPVGVLRRVELAANTELVASQSRVDPSADFAPPPDGYVLFGASAELELGLDGADVRVGVSGHNLLNTRYREYTSLLRYYADRSGRDVRVRVGVDF